MIMDWLVENKEWLFSGIGVAIGAAVIGRFFRTRYKKDSNVTQVQRSKGKNSPNIQSGRDTHYSQK